MFQLQERESERNDTERGFTLIELMIVVAIIAILAGILIPNFVNARAQAQTSACESNLRAIATSMELFYADNQHYPALGKIPDQINALGIDYLNNTPRDPADAASSAYMIENGPSGDNQSYTIACPGTHVATTLAKLTTTAGGLCGANCGSKTITWTSGIGLRVR